MVLLLRNMLWLVLLLLLLLVAVVVVLLVLLSLSPQTLTPHEESLAGE